MGSEEQLEVIEDHVSPSVSSPSRSGSPRPRKKKKMKRTRDLPNLTQCHSCGFRIDSCSGNDSLEILYSEWRIVLLCETCFVGVESSSLCSYCFKSGSSDDSFSCRQCKHIVHKSCFSSHVDVAPWSFCCSSAGADRFSVCLDCWVPKLVADKRVNCSGKRRNPLVFDLGSCRKRLLENVVMDADFDGQSKGGAAGTRAGGLAVKKGLGARRAAVSDVELAVPNGSIKIVKDYCSENSNSVATTNGSCRMLEDSPAETSVTVDGGNHGKACEMKVSLKDRGGGRSNGIMCYARRIRGNGVHDRWRIKYTRRASVNANSNQCLIKYARKTSTNQRYNEMLKRFGIIYTRRKLHQHPISVIGSPGFLYEAGTTQLSN